MIHEITSIKEKIPKETTLPDGFYNGIWGGYNIELKYKEKEYILTTKIGVKGIGYKVIVEIKNGVATFNEIDN